MKSLLLLTGAAVASFLVVALFADTAVSKEKRTKAAPPTE